MITWSKVQKNVRAFYGERKKNIILLYLFFKVNCTTGNITDLKKMYTYSISIRIQYTHSLYDKYCVHNTVSVVENA